ncbi:unnamed protein product [Adineta steineri]|uniref:Uncharacterized protein n=1 Tax=Adineta steineri TaxID=433720 RepID=A0A816BRD9_9BILA|nr:unnamed protein product [Adineta steineri]CAF1612416.1 unnamed protein product [Adineta steineri]
MCSSIRVAICGAGPSCLSQLHAFESTRQKDDNLRLKSSNSIYLPNLYKTIFWLDQPRLIDIGMQEILFLEIIKLSASKQEMELYIKQ